MLKLGKVAITGGLSSGKSLVCHFFRELGAYTLSSDEVVHELLNSNENIIQQVIDRLGSEVVVNDRLDRTEIAKKVFNQPFLLKALEKIIHPAVRDEIENHYKRVKTALFVVEIPLLFETGFDRDFDTTIAVIADEKICLKRFGNQIEYDKRMSSQMTQENKAKLADFVIENNGTQEELHQKVYELFHHLKEKN